MKIFNVNISLGPTCSILKFITRELSPEMLCYLLVIKYLNIHLKILALSHISTPGLSFFGIDLVEKDI